MVLITGILRKPRSNKIYTHEEYLRFEEKAKGKNEFYKGLIIPMAGAKLRHNQIATNITTAIKIAVRGLVNRLG
jgi:Uma2 family endonuclease